MKLKSLCVTVVIVASSLVACAGENDDKSSEIQLPNVVGMNLQAAQDCLQALGFWLLDDQPDYGEPRFQINDDNWTVSRQSPDPGMYLEDVKITLYSRKTGDFGQGSGSRYCP